MVPSDRNMTQTSFGNKGTFWGSHNHGVTCDLKLENWMLDSISTPSLTCSLSLSFFWISASLYMATSSSQTDFLSKDGSMLPKVPGSYFPCITIREKIFSAPVQKIPGNYSDWSGLGHVSIPWINFYSPWGGCQSPPKPCQSEGGKVLQMKEGYF